MKTPQDSEFCGVEASNGLDSGWMPARILYALTPYRNLPPSVPRKIVQRKSAGSTHETITRKFRLPTPAGPNGNERVRASGCDEAEAEVMSDLWKEI